MPANPIVESAMKLLALHPAAPPLEILDQAMKGARGSSPDFCSWDPKTGLSPHPAYDDDTDAGTPFGELLRRAFAPTLDPRELMLTRLAEAPDSPLLRDRISQVCGEWQQVIEAFADRYDLWRS